MVIAGPNSEGLVNPLRPLVATFSPVFHDHTVPLLPEGSRARPIAVTCQSGALTYAFLSRGRDRQLQFTYQISAGNQTVLEAHDYVDWVLDAGGADIFMCYLEGIRDPARFRAVADKAARAGKPMIVAKVGRSDAGRRAAASHTGALAHAGSADDAIFRHHGIIRGEDLDHMVDVATAFAYCKPPRGNRVAIITGSGGSAVWMADILSAHGLELPVLEEDIQRRLMAMLPSYASALNPIDATAQAIGEVGYAPMVELVRQSERIDTILLISSLANESRARKMADELAPITATLDKPILMATYTTASPAAIATLAGAGIACYTSMPSCARAIRALVDYGAFRERLARRAAEPPPPPVPRDEVARALALPGSVLTEHGSKALLARYGVPLPPEALAKSEDDAVAAAARIGGKVALKVQSPDILHKTEAGAVMLGLTATMRCATATARAVARQGGAPERACRGRAGAGDGPPRRRDDPRRHPRPRLRPDADGRARRHPCRGIARRRLRAGAARPRRRGAAARRTARRGAARRRARREAGRPRGAGRADRRAVALRRRPRRRGRRNRPEPGHRPPRRRGPDRRRRADRES